MISKNCLLLFIVLIHTSFASLYDSLNSIHFLNEGRVNAVDRYIGLDQKIMYTEIENVTKAEWAWGQEQSFKYLYQVDETKQNTCERKSIEIDTDYSGGDLDAFIGNQDDCFNSCCKSSSCVGFVFSEKAPSNFMSCQKDQPCCYMKDVLINKRKTQGLIAVQVNSTLAIKVPPVGMRSAIPLGGIGTGNIELRADGTLHEWTIFNQNPAGSAKYSTQDESLFMIKTKSLVSESHAHLLRTHPHVDLPGVPSLVYHGTYPVSKLSVPNDNNPFIADIDLYGFPHFVANNLNASLAPAIYWSLNAHNPTKTPITVSFLFSLSINIEQNQHRVSKNILKQFSSSSPVDCKDSCHQFSLCESWTYKNNTCILNKDTPYNEFEDNSFSGVKGYWSTTENSIILHHFSDSTSFGDISLSIGDNKDLLHYTSHYYTAESIQDLYHQFDSDTPSVINPNGYLGAISLDVVLQPNESISLPIIMTWFFPHHNYLSEKLDNFYTHLWNSSEDVYNYVNKNITHVVDGILKHHETIITSTLPDWLQDTLLNSLSHMRYAMYFSDGRWRQWEAPDCVNIDSIHNDYERHIPYMLYFPETERMKLYTWAKFQMENGMFREELAQGYLSDIPKLDSAIEFEGRRMSDCSSIFALALYEHYIWNQDKKPILDLYENAKRGLEWHLNVSKTYNIPERLCNTYDIMSPESYPLFGYNAVMHLLYIQVFKKLASIMNDQEWIEKANQEFLKATDAFNKYHWNGEYYKCYSNGEPANEGVNNTDPLMSDTFYGDVLSEVFGLDSIVNKEKLKHHLIEEFNHNQSPYGLIIMTGRNPVGGHDNDNHIWMMSPNDWSTLSIYLDIYDNNNIDTYLETSRKALENVRTNLHDMWNTHGVYYNFDGSLAGQPSITAHYGYHMTSWYIPYSLSGQLADLPNKKLSFNVKVKAPYVLPILLPNFNGQIIRETDNSAILIKVITGTIEINNITIDEILYPGNYTFTAGNTYTFE